MRKYCFRLLVLCLIILTISVVNTEASQTTTYTYTVVDQPSGDGKSHLARTQDAYIPERTVTDLGLSSPSDMFIGDDGYLYIADTGNKRIVIYDISLDVCIDEIECSGFKLPKGVCVTDNGYVYVADSMASAVFGFNEKHERVRKLERPNVPAFDATAFDPHKIAVDEYDNIYLVGEGVYNGIIQLSDSGEFLGFFAVNDTKLSLLQRIQSLIFTREQKDKISDINPTTFANIGIDSRGILYTVTNDETVNAIKKHKTNGSNMFTSTVFSNGDMTDVWVDEQFLVYASSKQGYIDIYTSDGDLIFEFGSNETRLDVAGLFNSLVSLAVDKEGYIWALDGAKGYLQSYRPTEYATQIYTALSLYDAGYYEDALAAWGNVLVLNQMSVIAHNGMGNAYMSKYDFENAMLHYEIAGNHEKYSDSFWELRNMWLQKYLATFMIAILAIVAIVFCVTRFDKKKRVTRLLASVKNGCKKLKWAEEISLPFKVARHPLDSYYDIGIGKSGNVIIASILYLLLFLAFMLYMIDKGFIYQYQDVRDMDISSLVIGFFAIISLFVVSNYLVTSINDGEGSLKQVFYLVSYSSLPVTVALLCVTGLSYVVTNNESFFMTVGLLTGVTWTLVLVFVGLMTVHNYTVKGTIGSIILTFVLMLVVVIVVMVITIMWDKVWSFLSTAGEELKQYVLG